MANDAQTGILLFGLDGKETFGINVFKVKSIINTPPITSAPGTDFGTIGMISLRGDIIPVIDLAGLLGLPAPERTPLLIITEFRRHIQAFAVGSVDRIIHVDTSELRPTGEIFGDGGHPKVTSVIRRENDDLVSVIDVEQILPNSVSEEEFPTLPECPTEKFVFFVEDSPLAAKEIARTLDGCKIKHKSARDGREAIDRLRSMADVASKSGHKLSDEIMLILTDAEMPEMNGYELTRTVRSEDAFNGIPVVMHSSVAATVNAPLSKEAGAEEYVEKFEPVHLSDIFAKYCRNNG